MPPACESRHDIAGSGLSTNAGPKTSTTDFPIASSESMQRLLSPALCSTSLWYEPKRHENPKAPCARRWLSPQTMCAWQVKPCSGRYMDNALIDVAGANIFDAKAGHWLPVLPAAPLCVGIGILWPLHRVAPWSADYDRNRQRQIRRRTCAGLAQPFKACGLVTS